MIKGVDLMLCNECITRLYGRMSDNELLVLVSLSDQQRAVNTFFNKFKEKVKAPEIEDSLNKFRETFVQEWRSIADISNDTGAKYTLISNALNHFYGMGIVDRKKREHSYLYQIRPSGMKFIELLMKDKVRADTIYSNFKKD